MVRHKVLLKNPSGFSWFFEREQPSSYHSDDLPWCKFLMIKKSLQYNLNKCFKRKREREQTLSMVVRYGLIKLKAMWVVIWLASWCLSMSDHSLYYPAGKIYTYKKVIMTTRRSYEIKMNNSKAHIYFNIVYFVCF